MNNRVVLAFFGDGASIAAVRQWSSSAQVIAVAFDLGGGVPLDELRDGALSAGAVRCHCLDVREEFARDALLPAIRARVFADPADALSAMALDFVSKKLREVAAMEKATVVALQHNVPPARFVAPCPVPPRHLAIEFADGVPVAVNGIPMTLTELMESVETITGESALAVLQRQYAMAIA